MPCVLDASYEPVLDVFAFVRCAFADNGDMAPYRECPTFARRVPDGWQCVGVVHEDGPGAARSFCRRYAHLLVDVLPAH